MFSNQGFSPESTFVGKYKKKKEEFMVFLTLKSLRVSKLKQETVIYTRQIALPVMLQSTFEWSLYQYFSF